MSALKRSFPAAIEAAEWVFDPTPYVSLAETLRAYGEAKKAVSPKFSLGAWARKLGLKSSGPLHEMVRGKRLPTPEIAGALPESMGLKGAAADYVLFLAERDRVSGSPEAFAALGRTADRLRKAARTQTLEIRHARMLASTWHFVVWNLFSLANPPRTVAEVRETLGVTGEEAAVERIVHDLRECGLLALSPDGGLRVSGGDFLETVNDVPSAAVREFHRKSLAAACDSLESVPVLERHFTSYVFRLAENDLPEAKREIETFIDGFVARFSFRAQAAERVFQINMNLVPRTRKRRAS
ncbi:MAG: TIGR02147 family protein [Bdellovibrionales bacterium]|nr:TIGR02147 family protein [Bdellovibrionales bacterium]